MVAPRFRGTNNTQAQVSAGRRNTHSPPIRRYLLTMVCAMTGALGALWVANMESNSIKKASDETHTKRTENSTDATGRRRQFRPSPPSFKVRKDTMEEKNDKLKHGMEADKDHKAGIHGINIALIGERNTGTRWTFSELQKCFPEHVVKPRLIRWKHWFQEDDGKDHTPTIVVAQFRNPYEWVEAMRVVPHHAPEHMFLEWKEFVTKPWTIDRPKRDINFREQGGEKCYEGFSYNELISCVEGDRKDEDHLERLKVNPREGYFSGHKPIYELNVDKSGTPYDNILKFRAAKIKNFLDVEKWKWVKKVIPVQYETLLSRGNEWLIKEIESALNYKTECTPSPPQSDRKRRNVTEGYVQYITEHLDWDMEKLIDYGQAGGPGGFLLDSQIIIENKEDEEDLEHDDEDGDEKISEDKEKVIKLVDDDNNEEEDEDNNSDQDEDEDNNSDEEEDEDNNSDEDEDHDNNSDEEEDEDENSEEDNVNDDSSSSKNEISNDMNEDDEVEENNEEPDNQSNDTNNKESESNNEDEEDNDSINEDNEGEEIEVEKSYNSKSRNDDDDNSSKAKDDDESTNEDEEEEKEDKYGVKKSHSSESRRKDDDEEDNEKHESKTDSEDYKEDKYILKNKEEKKKDSNKKSNNDKDPIIHEKNDSTHDEKDDEKSSGKKIIDLGIEDEGGEKKRSSSSSNKKDEKSDEKIIDLGVEENDSNQS